MHELNWNMVDVERYNIGFLTNLTSGLNFQIILLVSQIMEF